MKQVFFPLTGIYPNDLLAVNRDGQAIGEAQGVTRLSLIAGTKPVGCCPVQVAGLYNKLVL